MPTDVEVFACWSIKREVMESFAELNHDSFWETPHIGAALSSIHTDIEVHFVARRAADLPGQGWFEVYAGFPLSDLEVTTESNIRDFANNMAASLDRFRGADWKAAYEERRREYREALSEPPPLWPRTSGQYVVGIDPAGPEKDETVCLHPEVVG